jgi:hypothetical protein
MFDCKFTDTWRILSHNDVTYLRDAINYFSYVNVIFIQVLNYCQKGVESERERSNGKLISLAGERERETDKNQKIGTIIMIVCRGSKLSI